MGLAAVSSAHLAGRAKASSSGTIRAPSAAATTTMPVTRAPGCAARYAMVVQPSWSMWWVYSVLA
jgi:hypothetical protein